MLSSLIKVGVVGVSLSLGGCGGTTSSSSGSPGAGGDSGAGATGGGSGATGGSGGSVGGSASGGSNVGGSMSGGSGGDSGSGTGGSSAGSGGTGGSGGSGGVTSGCESQDVAGVGMCAAAFGPFFINGQCSWVGGCSCEGTDCGNAYSDEAECALANRGCMSCSPQEATATGFCEPVPFFVFTGVECLPMAGCGCIGEDCGSGTYSTLEDCEAAHATCFAEPRTCDQIQELYQEYASRDACEEDADCIVQGGHCGVGLGGCHYLMSSHWPGSGLEKLAMEWQGLGCGGNGVCDCAGPPASAVCANGSCVGAP